jgi:hypothetical protein
MYPTGSRYTIVNTVTRLRAGRSRNHSSIPGRGNRLFSSPNRTSRPALGQLQPSVLGDLPSGVKGAVREVDHKPPSSVEVK